jgi:hypothetical protein
LRRGFHPIFQFIFARLFGRVVSVVIFSRGFLVTFSVPCDVFLSSRPVVSQRRCAAENVYVSLLSI